MAEYTVEVVRSGGWWAVTVPALPGVFTQARRLDQVENMAIGAIAMFLGVDPVEVGEVTVRVTPPASAARLIDEMERAGGVARSAAAAASAARRQAARMLRDEGLPIRDVGTLLGVSHQRVSQILDEGDRD